MNSETSDIESDAKSKNQFEKVLGAVEDVTSWSRDYFTPERITHFMTDLDNAKKKLEAGELQTKPARVNVYKGANRDTVTDLYAFFSSIAGKGSATYENLEHEIGELYNQGQIFIEGTKYDEGSKYAGLVIGDELALTDGMAPSGIQLKMTENIFATFRLGAFGDRENPHKIESSVDLVIVDIEG